MRESCERSPHGRIRHQGPPQVVSPRQREAFELYCQGRTIREIAVILNASPHAVGGWIKRVDEYDRAQRSAARST